MTLFNSFNNYDILLLLSLYLISIILGVFIIISKNPIFSVLFLIGLFFVVALYLISIGLTFLGLSYLLVYVGAISILFLFILMLINIRISELITEGKNSIPLAILTIVSITYILGNILPYNTYILDIIFNNSTNLFESDNIKLYSSSKNVVFLDNNISNIISDNIAEIKNYNWELVVIPMNHVSSLGKIFYADLYINIILISMILLLAMIGAIIITIKKDDSKVVGLKYSNNIILKSTQSDDCVINFNVWSLKICLILFNININILLINLIS